MVCSRGLGGGLKGWVLAEVFFLVMTTTAVKTMMERGIRTCNMQKPPTQLPPLLRARVPSSDNDLSLIPLVKRPNAHRRNGSENRKSAHISNHTNSPLISSPKIAVQSPIPVTAVQQRFLQFPLSSSRLSCRTSKQPKPHPSSYPQISHTKTLAKTHSTLK